MFSCPKAVPDRCWECTGRRPSVFINAHSACGGKGADDGQIPRFPYMPRVLKYIVSELLKNSCRATTDMLSAHELEAADFPINVINFLHGRRPHDNMRHMEFSPFQSVFT